ncbi:hypothetical protein NDU88_003337 [Pleurodeles waltl]|uniref:Uncharacterized protein n=1 Tax=Pleurodeles waltl TaxID=8319 RepID=A0AAV7W5W4_PLEWA|nr:hypothetical protein NDU88_003337 [Pleurodeles waltl]
MGTAGAWADPSWGPGCGAALQPCLMGLSSKPGFSQSKLTSQSLGGCSLPPACRTLEGLDVHWAKGGFPCWFGFRGTGQGCGRPQGWTPLPGVCPPARHVVRHLGRGPGWPPLRGGVQRVQAGPRAPTGPWDGHSLPPACYSLRGPGLGVRQAQGGFPFQFEFRGPAGPRTRALAGPGVGAPVLVFVLLNPKARAPGEPLRPHVPAIWLLRLLRSSGCSPCIPMARLDGHTALDVQMGAHLLPQSQPGLHEVEFVLAYGRLRHSVCTEYQKGG